VRLFKTKWFTRYARQEDIADASLREAISRAERGLIDADLGGHVIKQRIARKGQGRSGGHRALIAFYAAERAVFIFGFTKNVRDNISANELTTLKEIAAKWVGADPAEIERAMDEGLIVEVKYEN
jgi:hypothetical protein